MNTPLVTSNIPATITYLEKELRGEAIKTSQKIREIERLYIKSSDVVHQNLLKLVRKFGDSLTVRQIIFFHYLQQQPLIKDLLCKYIYPSLQQASFFGDEAQLRLFIRQYRLTKRQQMIVYRCLEKVFAEVKISLKQGYLSYQRPTIETIAYAFYAEYGEGFPESRRFFLKNPPLEQIIKFAAFPAYFLINPKIIPAILETCRLKNYLTLELRGGLNQYVLLHQDLTDLVDFMTQGGT